MAKKDKPEPEVEAELPEGEAAEGAEETPAKKKLPIKLIAIAGLALVLVLGGGGTAAFLFLKPKPAEVAQAGAEKAAKAKEAKKKKEKGGEKKGEGEKLAGTMKEGPDGVVFYTMPDLSANMQTQDGRPSFLKLKVTFELPNEEAVETLESNMPRLQDMFLTFMRELRHEDVAGSQGNYTLRLEIQRRVNMVIAPQKVNAVLIEEMLET